MPATSARARSPHVIAQIERFERGLPLDNLVDRGAAIDTVLAEECAKTRARPREDVMRLSLVHSALAPCFALIAGQSANAWRRSILRRP